MEEIWKDIPGYNGMYQVSNMGRVKSLKYKKPKILKPLNSGDNKHYRVRLYKNGAYKKKEIHVLEYEVFHNCTVKKGYVVHHVDFNPHNNELSNLQLLTRAEHMKVHNCRPILMCNRFTGEVIMEFSSITEASIYLGKSSPGLIGKQLTGKRNHAYGYVWKYK